MTKKQVKALKEKLIAENGKVMQLPTIAIFQNESVKDCDILNERLLYRELYGIKLEPSAPGFNHF